MSRRHLAPGLAAGPHRAAPGPLRAARAALLFLGLGLGLGLPGLSCVAVPDELYCASDEDCRDRGADLICDEVRHECEPVPQNGCRRDEQCNSPQRPLCDRQTSECVACAPPDDAAPSPACAHFSDPPRPFCVRQGQATLCAECMGNPDCPVSRPICDGNVCRPCREHKECGPEVVCDDPTDPSGKSGKPCKNSWVCMNASDAPELKDRGGRCASNSPTTGRVVYAQYFMGRCGDDWTGTPTEPRCTIDGAVAAALDNPGRVRYVRLLGSVFPPAAPISRDGARLIIVGAETKLSPMPASVQGAGTLIEVGGKGASVTLDQVTLKEDQPRTTVLRCNSGGMAGTTLTVRRSVILGATTAANVMMDASPAIDSIGCDTTLLLSTIGAQQAGQPAHSAGVRFQGTDGRSYRVVGNLIAGNQGPALLLSPSAAIDLRFNTIVKNGRGTAAGGISCAFGTAAKIGQSIISDNTLSGTSQFGGECNLTFERDVVGPAEMGAAGADRSPPNLDAKTFRLTAQSAAAIDKVPAAPDFPDRDIDGNARPQGAAFDIGAHELVP